MKGLRLAASNVAAVCAVFALVLPGGVALAADPPAAGNEIPNGPDSPIVSYKGNKVDTFNFPFTEQTKAVVLPDGQNGWGWDPATATLTLRNYDNSKVVASQDDKLASNPKDQNARTRVVLFETKKKVTVKFEGTNHLATNFGSGVTAESAVFMLKNSGEHDAGGLELVGDDDASLTLETRATNATSVTNVIHFYNSQAKNSPLVFKSGSVNMKMSTAESACAAASGDKKIPGEFMRHTNDVQILGNASLTQTINSTCKDKTAYRTLLAGNVKGSESRVLFDTTKPVTLATTGNSYSMEEWSWVESKAYPVYCDYSGKASVNFTEGGAPGCLPRSTNENVLIGSISPVNLRYQNPIPDEKNPGSYLKLGQFLNEDSSSKNTIVPTESMPIAVGQVFPITVTNGVASHGKFAINKAFTDDKTAIAADADVTVKADTAPAGQTFDKWVATDNTSLPAGLDESAEQTTFSMPASAVALKATYKPLPAPAWNDSKVTPGNDVNIPNTGGPVQKGTMVSTDGPGKAELNKDGSITVTADPKAKAGDTITVTVKDAQGNTVDTIAVKVYQDQRENNTKTQPKTGKNLPKTGTSMGALGLASAVLIPAGMGLVLARRRRQN